MARGPAIGTNRVKDASQATVRAFWADTAPAWVLDLANACDATSQNAVAGRIGYSAATVSNVLRNKYPADMTAIAEAVGRLVAGGAVDCPALGDITDEECAGWRDKAKQLSTANPQRVQMRAACLKCGRFKR